MLRESRRWKKGILFFNLCMALFLCPLCVKAEEVDKEVTIYGLSSSDKEAISIPSELPESYQFSVGNGENVTYSIASGSSAKVSADGLVTPKYTYWKRQSGFSISVSEGQDYDYYTLSSGDTKIVAKAAGKTYNLTVHVKDYAITYGDEVMDAYLQDNVNDTMTDKEIMQAIARFPASFDYSASHSSVYSMIIYGGGDCWASTGAITALCERLGIKAWSRNGNKDPGAGSGHLNAMAELNGVYYELEAGYAMEKKDGYRPYSVTVRDSLFSYSYSSSNGLSIYQYDGDDTTGVLEIPEQISGKTVTEIGKSAFASTKFSEIKLPDTVTAIGDFAFSSCKNLTSIQIPASVTSIGASAFVSCEKLEDISIASGNLNYKAENQVIYTKDGSTLVTCPVAGEVLIPSTVTKIADYAFYYNGNLKRIVIPESVTEMGEGAFGNCSQLSEVLFEGDGLISVGTHCFRSDSSLSVIRIPSSVQSLGAYAFAYCNKLKNIYFMGEAPEFGETIEGTFYDNVFSGCTGNAYYIEDSGTWTDEALSGHGGTIEWSAWKGNQAISIEEAVLNLEQSSYTYTGREITPQAALSLNGLNLVENEDYIVNYSNNIKAGTATVTAMGIGDYDGAVSVSFTIGKAKPNVRAYAKSSRIMENTATEIYCYPLDGEYTYTSSDASVAEIDSEGVITGISAGTAVLTVNVAETENYLAASVPVNITVTHDTDILLVDGAVTDGRIKVKCKQCDTIYSATVPTEYSIYWSRKGSSYYYSNCESEYDVGETLRCICNDTSDADLGEMEIISQDTRVITVTEEGYLNFIADGVASVEVRPKYNPSIGRTFTFYVGNVKAEEEKDKNDDKTGNIPNKDEDDKKTEEVTQYYDPATGMTVCVKDKSKKTAVLTSVDTKHIKKTLSIPNKVILDGTSYTITEIEKKAFKNNKKLEKVVIGEKVETIGAEAFSGCKKLKTVTIGKNVKAIGSKAFYKCKKLKNITIKTKKLTSKTVGSKAFKDIYAKASIKVPKSKLAAYKKLLKTKGVGKKAKIKK